MAEGAAVRLGDLVRHVRARLAQGGIADAALDARLLVATLTGASATDLVARPDAPVAAADASEIEDAVRRRLGGEPVHRILGFRGFYGLDLRLGPATLEPRPDTETLVDLALPAVRAIAAAKGACRLLDLGTGTGAIALAILSHVPEAQAVATDISEDALAVARLNARALGFGGRFEAVRSDWFGDVAGRFDAILSNPPYIKSGDIAALDTGVREFDPIAALDGGAGGLDAYGAIASGAFRHLDDAGFIAVEIGKGQAAEVTAMFTAGGFRLGEVRNDLGGVERALLFTV